MSHPLLNAIAPTLRSMGLCEPDDETIAIGQIQYTVPAPVAYELASLRRELAETESLRKNARACLDQERQHHGYREELRTDTLAHLEALLQTANDRGDLLDGIRGALRILRGYA